MNHNGLSLNVIVKNHLLLLNIIGLEIIYANNYWRWQ